MARGRPSFFATDSSDGEADLSRSTSRERDAVNEPLPLPLPGPSPRKSSFSTVVNIPQAVSELPDDDNDDEAHTFLALESDALLPHSLDHPSPRRRVPPSSYGSFNEHYVPPHFVNVAPPEPGLGRSESVFKLSGMIDDKGGDFEKFRMSDEQMKGMSRKVRHFYETQNEILDGFKEVDEILDNTRAMAATGELAPMIPTKPSAGREEAFNLKVKLAINVNFLVNFILLGSKIAIVLVSSSMSLIASTVDSAMDFLSTVIIYGTSRIIDHKDWKSAYNYPTGKRRMEPMGVVVFSVFMIASFLQVFIESVQRLLDPHLEPVFIPLIGKIVMIATIAIKGVVWIWCRRIKNSSVEALAQDAENDIVFNFFSLLFPFIGEQIGWAYLDPLGGALLSVYIIVEWTSTLLETITKLTGKRASPQEHQRVAYLLVRFSPLIKCIQHLSVYHTGDSYIVETDVVLPSQTDLTVAHNVAESAQYGLEQLDRIERAFVHVDITVNPLSGHVDR